MRHAVIFAELTLTLDVEETWCMLAPHPNHQTLFKVELHSLEEMNNKHQQLQSIMKTPLVSDMLKALKYAITETSDYQKSVGVIHD